jgi:hypothetical protein
VTALLLSPRMSTLNSFRHPTEGCPPIPPETRRANE